MDSEYILVMRDICKSFPGVRALDHAHLEIRRGEVHALAGENGAGKSTLMKILTGTYALDEGEIILRDEPVHFATPNQARTAGISMIHQELNLVPEMSAAQNIFLGTNVGTYGMGVLDRRQREQLARQALADLNVHIDVTVPVRRLSVAHQQMIEIAKALSIKSDILVMDEPTSSLTDREIETLYEVIASLKQRNVAVIYISHRLDEIFDLSNRVTVLRDGRNVITEDTQNLTMDDLVRSMVGRELQRFFHRDRPGSAEWDEDQAAVTVRRLLEQYPDIQGFYAANDAMALGVAGALQTLGLPGRVRVVGTDGTPAAVAALAAGKLDATIGTFPYDTGRAAVRLAVRALEGQKLPPRITRPVALITAGNIEQVFASSDHLSAAQPADPILAQPAPVASRPYRIGVVLKYLGNQHWAAMSRGSQAGAAECNVNVEVVAAPSEDDFEQQAVLARQLLDGGCDALCLAPITCTSLDSVIVDAVARGVPVINVEDAQILSSTVTTFVSADQRAVGATAAECLSKMLPAGARVAMIEGKAGSQAAQLRRQGFCDSIKAAGLSLTLNQEIALEVKNLSTITGVKNVSFGARWGEIFGIAGLVGAGRTELVRAIFGADPIVSGTISVDGRQRTIHSPRDAVAAGIGFLTEDRKGQGLVLPMSVGSNATLTILDRLSPMGVLRRRKRKQIATDYVQRLNIKTPSLSQPVKFLSGGNQQKVVLAKWLVSQSKILIFDEPTRGIDVGAKVEVRELMNELAKQGACIILISSELPEVLGLCDRLLVMHEGSVTGEFEALSTSEEEVLNRASGLLPKALQPETEALS